MDSKLIAESRSTKTRSLSLPYRKRKNIQSDDDDAGFRPQKRVQSPEKNYNHDRDNIRLLSFDIGKAGKKIYKNQKEIERKTKKEEEGHTSKKLSQFKEKYDENMTTLVKSLKKLKEIVCEPEDNIPQDQKRTENTDGCSECFHQEIDKLQVLADNERLKKQLTEERRANKEALASLKRDLVEEREAKHEALTRLSALTSSRLRNNNPNLTDLSDPCRPSKIGEMFSELYDNEWTNAYDELSKSKTEVDKIRDLNNLVKAAFDCCMELLKPCRLYLDSSLTKIDSEFRQKIIGHFKQHALAVIPKLHEDLLVAVNTRCNIKKSTGHLAIYTKKCIDICWLMAIQDPPMHLCNDAPERFNTSLYREYQHKGQFTAYVVWPALALNMGGALLSKGIAEGKGSNQAVPNSSNGIVESPV